MVLNRRSFIQSSLAAGVGLLMNPVKGFAGAPAPDYMALHPFVEANPSAVFIMRTDVDVKTNAGAMKAAGRAFADSVLGLTDNQEIGIPLTQKFVFKPNLTCRFTWHDQYSVEGSMGIVTDSNFMEGIIESMKDLGISGSQMYIREVNCEADLEDGGYLSMAQRTGIDLAGIETPYYDLSPEQIQWKEVPQGTYFNNIPYLWPVNAPDTWLMNVAKLKAHAMGLTLCAKNLQGTIAMNYQEHCRSFGTNLDIRSSDFHSDAFTNIMNSYNSHVSEGVPRWDKPGNSGGLWMETWASRCLDNNSVTSAGLHVIEGIYGRDGHFIEGPSSEGLATDYMCNYIIFGKNAFNVDVIGHWLGGHEPGNFGLFHMARERNMMDHFNPHDISLYEWDAATGASQAQLSEFDRTDLKTSYLTKDYDGGVEDKWHLVNEAFDYGASGIGTNKMMGLSFTLGNCYPNPVKWKTTIPYQIQKPGHVYMELINSHDMVIEVLEDSYRSSGNHMVSWQSLHHPPGLYLYRMRFEGMIQTGKILVYH